MKAAGTPIVHIRRLGRRFGLVAAVLAAACFAAEVKIIGPGSAPGGGTDPGGGGGGAAYTLTISPPSGTIAVGAILQLGLTLRDAQGTSVPVGTVTWSTSNGAVLAVDQSGQIRGVAIGTAVVTASASGVAATTTFTVVTTPVATVVVSPSVATLQLGSTSQFTAVARDALGNTLVGRAVTWSTSNAAVLTVDGTGRASAVGTGSATLTAASEGRTGTAAVTVQNVPVATVQVTPGLDTIQVTQQTQLVATPRDGSGNALSGRTITWSSTAPGIARVSGNGLIDGLAPGTATIRATSEGQTGSATIVVIPIPVAVVQVVPQAVSVQIGATTTFTATPRDANGNAITGRTVTWSSGNPAVATVSTGGVVTGVTLGTVLISATVDAVVGSAFVTITAAPATLVSVTIGPPTAALLSGQTQQFSLTGTLSDNSTIPVTGTYQATGGTVNGSGMYTAPDQSGTFLVIGTASGTSLRDTATVTVTRPPVATVTVSPTSATLNVGQTQFHTATLRDASGNILTNRIISWTTTNAAVATVNGNGLVTGVAPGTATVRATSEGQSATSAITVQIVPVASVQVTPTSASVAIGLTLTITATCRDANGNTLVGRVVNWSSSNGAIASVSAGGVVTGVAVGTATITANCEGPTASAIVTVALAPPPQLLYPNEPAGSTVLIDWDFDITRAGNPPFFYVSRGGALTVTDVAAPVNPSKIGRIQFDPSLTAGTGPSILASSLLPPSGWRSWYFSMWWKVSSNYINQMSFKGLKIWDMLTAGPNGSIIIQLYGGTPPFNMLLSLQSNGITDTYGTIPLQRETWYQVELLVTDQGNGQARYQLFVNGQLDINRLLPKVTNAEFKHNWVMGGGPGTITVTSYIYHDHTRLSYTR